MATHDLHLHTPIGAGPTTQEEIKEIWARNRRFQVQSLFRLTAGARAHHNAWLALKQRGMDNQAANERILARDCICRAKPIRAKLLGAHFA